MTSPFQFDELIFATAVEKHFAFLSDYGFALAEISPDCVVYRNHEVALAFDREARSHEVSLAVTRRGRRYPLGLLLTFAGFDEGWRHRDPTATTAGQLDAALQRMSAAVVPMAPRILRTDAEYFDALDRYRTQHAERLALESRASQLRGKAATAFKAGDYATAAALYQQIEPLLTRAERSKLAMAMTRCRRAGGEMK